MGDTICQLPPLIEEGPFDKDLIFEMLHEVSGGLYTYEDNWFEDDCLILPFSLSQPLGGSLEHAVEKFSSFPPSYSPPPAADSLASYPPGIAGELNIETLNVPLYYDDDWFTSPWYNQEEEDVIRRAVKLAFHIRDGDWDVLFIQEIYHDYVWELLFCILELIGYDSDLLTTQHAFHFNSVNDDQADLAVFSKNVMQPHTAEFIAYDDQVYKAVEAAKHLTRPPHKEGFGSIQMQAFGQNIALATAHTAFRAADEKDTHEYEAEYSGPRAEQHAMNAQHLERLRQASAVIYAGDLNAERGDFEYDVMREGSPTFAYSSDFLAKKYPGQYLASNAKDLENPRGLIDHINVSEAFIIKNAEIVQNDLGDHAGVTARVQLKSHWEVINSIHAQNMYAEDGTRRPVMGYQEMVPISPTTRARIARGVESAEYHWYSWFIEWMNGIDPEEQRRKGLAALAQIGPREAPQDTDVRFASTQHKPNAGNSALVGSAFWMIDVGDDWSKIRKKTMLPFNNWAP